MVPVITQTAERSEEEDRPALSKTLPLIAPKYPVLSESRAKPLPNTAGTSDGFPNEISFLVQ